jgi:hypothetical protein
LVAAFLVSEKLSCHARAFPCAARTPHVRKIAHDARMRFTGQHRNRRFAAERPRDA